MIKIQKAFNEKRELIEMQPLKLDEIFLS